MLESRGGSVEKQIRRVIMRVDDRNMLTSVYNRNYGRKSRLGNGFVEERRVS